MKVLKKLFTLMPKKNHFGYTKNLTVKGSLRKPSISYFFKSKETF